MHAHLFFHIHILLAYARTLTPSHVPQSRSHAHTIQCYCRDRFLFLLSLGWISLSPVFCHFVTVTLLLPRGDYFYAVTPDFYAVHFSFLFSSFSCLFRVFFLVARYARVITTRLSCLERTVWKKWLVFAHWSLKFPMPLSCELTTM